MLTCLGHASTLADILKSMCELSSHAERATGSMIGENWQLVTDEPVEFEK